MKIKINHLAKMPAYAKASADEFAINYLLLLDL